MTDWIERNLPEEPAGHQDSDVHELPDWVCPNTGTSQCNDGTGCTTC
jgi:hypothetical protein